MKIWKYICIISLQIVCVAEASNFTIYVIWNTIYNPHHLEDCVFNLAMALKMVKKCILHFYYFILTNNINLW